MDFQTTKDNLRASASKQKKLMPLIDTQRKQEQKARDAAEYRARILQKQRRKMESCPPPFSERRRQSRHQKRERTIETTGKEVLMARRPRHSALSTSPIFSW